MSVKYRAKRACIITGVYRRTGEVFETAEIDPPSPHLDIISADAPAPAKAKKNKGVTAADLGDPAQAVNSFEVTSADLLKKEE